MATRRPSPVNQSMSHYPWWGWSSPGHSCLPSSWYHRRPVAIVFLGRKKFNSLPQLLKHCKKPLASPHLVAPYMTNFTLKLAVWNLYLHLRMITCCPIWTGCTTQQMNYILKLIWLGPLEKQPLLRTKKTYFSSILCNYEDIFDGTVLPAMSGEPFKINLKPVLHLMLS